MSKQTSGNPVTPASNQKKYEETLKKHTSEDDPKKPISKPRTGGAKPVRPKV